jgi:GMP synthase-like glutamine amidotransferase
MSVLILKNVAHEGPGTIEDFLLENNVDYKIVEMYSESLPSTENVDNLIIMGGPMSANDTDTYPYIKKEIELVKDFISKGKKVFGICLGAQIMAKTLGAHVYVGPEPEIGWYDIELQENGIRDPVVSRLGIHPGAGNFQKNFKVFHWHGETFDIPTGAVRIATSAIYPNQAFKYGSNAYAFQFHIEVRKEMIHEWLQKEPFNIESIKKETVLFYEEYIERAKNFYKAFFTRDA